MHIIDRIAYNITLQQTFEQLKSRHRTWALDGNKQLLSKMPTLVNQNLLNLQPLSMSHSGAPSKMTSMSINEVKWHVPEKEVHSENDVNVKCTSASTLRSNRHAV